MLDKITDVDNHDIDTSLIDNLVGAQILLRKSAERISALRGEIYRLEKEVYRLTNAAPANADVPKSENTDKTATEVKLKRAGLSTRSRNALRQAGFKTLGQVYNIPKNHLLRLNNFGKISLREVENVMREHGFTNW